MGHTLRGNTMIKVTCKNGDTFLLNDQGHVVQRETGMTFGDPHPSWQILGFLTRWNSHRIVTLADALEGASIGHGFVVDLDHGTRRVWGGRGSSVAKVERT